MDKEAERKIVSRFVECECQQGFLAFIPVNMPDMIDRYKYQKCPHCGKDNEVIK